MELYIVRHGKTDWNKECRFQGAKDIPLNEEGRAAAEKLHERLKDIHFDAVFSSPLSRAYETAWPTHICRSSSNRILSRRRA